MAKNTDVPGNTLASQAQLDRLLNKIGQAVFRLEACIDKDLDDDLVVTGIRFKPPQAANGEWMAVISASTPDGHVVAFHSASGLGELVKGLTNRYTNRSLKWRPDEYK